MRELHYTLPTGTLALVTPDGFQPTKFFTVAARENPNRAFLFVSKLLGKHLPTPPAVMRKAQESLAEDLDKQIKELTKIADAPILFIGMAETATALGQGVYEAWREENPQQESLYLSTTRYQIAGFERIEFSEEHSHAPAIGLHIPQQEHFRKTFYAAKTLVLIDDELSTGKTFVNLVRTLRQQGLPLEEVFFVSLTDFTHNNLWAIDSEVAPLGVHHISNVFGAWDYYPKKEIEVSQNWKTQTGVRVTLPAGGDFAARTGTNHLSNLSPSLLQAWQQLILGKEKILVLGCGEFMYFPFLLAQMAEKEGIKTYFCATTRSPIKIWGDIEQRYEWQDPYGEGVRNFLYNYQRENYDDVFFISELPENEILQQIAKELEATLFCLPKYS